MLPNVVCDKEMYIFQKPHCASDVAACCWAHVTHADIVEKLNIGVLIRTLFLSAKLHLRIKVRCRFSCHHHVKYTVFNICWIMCSEHSHGNLSSFTCMFICKCYFGCLILGLCLKYPTRHHPATSSSTPWMNYVPVAMLVSNAGSTSYRYLTNTQMKTPFIWINLTVFLDCLYSQGEMLVPVMITL